MPSLEKVPDLWTWAGAGIIIGAVRLCKPIASVWPWPAPPQTTGRHPLIEKRHASYLLTPGPLTTAAETKAAMASDKTPNSPDFVAMVKEIRDYGVDLAHGGEDYTCVAMPGSASFGIEAAFRTLVDLDSGHVLVVENGFYGCASARFIAAVGFKTSTLAGPTPRPSRGRCGRPACGDPTITHLALATADTGTGKDLNPITR
jgi:2-aminoethylphosphonate-pyruvate transaminase